MCIRDSVSCVPLGGVCSVLLLGEVAWLWEQPYCFGEHFVYGTLDDIPIDPRVKLVDIRDGLSLLDEQIEDFINRDSRPSDNKVATHSVWIGLQVFHTRTTLLNCSGQVNQASRSRRE